MQPIQGVLGEAEGEKMTDTVAKPPMDFKKLFKDYGTWVIVAVVGLFVMGSLKKKGGGGRPKVD